VYGDPLAGYWTVLSADCHNANGDLADEPYFNEMGQSVTRLLLLGLTEEQYFLDLHFNRGAGSMSRAEALAQIKAGYLAVVILPQSEK
jgi:hypothetical protein